MTSQIPTPKICLGKRTMQWALKAIGASSSSHSPTPSTDFELRGRQRQAGKGSMIVGKISEADVRRNHLTYWRKEQPTHPASHPTAPARPS